MTEGEAKFGKFPPAEYSFYPDGTSITVDGLSGDSSVRYYDHRLASELSELDIHKSSLYFTLETANFLRRLVERDPTLKLGVDQDILEVSLWEAVLVSYARCFDGNGPHPLKASSYLDQNQLAMHDSFYWARQRHVAHDLNGFRQNYTGLEIGDEGDIRAIRFLHIVRAYGLDDLKNAIDLIELAIQEAEQRISGGSLIFTASASLLTPEQLLALPMLQPEASFDVSPSEVRRTNTQRKRRQGEKKSS